jgi:hypothetical protein
MTLKDRLKPAPSATSPPSFTCPHYDPPPGEKRCRSFIGNGSCSRPDELMCTEWLKANGQAAPSPQAAPQTEHPPLRLVRDTTPRDLFGNPLPEPPKPSPPSKPAVLTAACKTDVPGDPPIVRNLSDEEIRSFRALGVEVCVASEALGEIWIVPAYTGATRKEISVEHAATLTAICAAFPGAKVVQYERAEPLPPTEPPI